MLLAAVILAVTLGAAAPGADQAARPVEAITMQVGADAARRGGLLDTRLAVTEDDAAAAEEGLVSGLQGRWWLQLVPNAGEVAAAVTRCQRSQSSHSRSKDGDKVTIDFRYTVVAAVAIEGDRDTVDTQVTISHSYRASTSRMVPTDREDRSAFQRAGRELAPKVRSWVLPRIASLRPDGADAGFRHKVKFKWLVMPQGLEVTDVFPGSPAQQAGLQVGDLIKRVDREDSTAKMDERVWAWRLEAAGTRVRLEFERNSQRRTIDVTLITPPRERRHRAGSGYGG